MYMYSTHLSTDHGECLALRGVDLPRHDGAARFVLRQQQLTQAASGSTAKEADVIGDL
jgi:hypothetical protein